MNGETFTEYILKGFTEKQMLYKFLEILIAVMVLHKNQLIHGDLKSDNIMVCDDHSTGEYSIKVIDFGECRRVHLYQTVVGSPIPTGTDEYAPPEQIKDGKENIYYDGPHYQISFESDIYALGSILVDIYGGVNKTRVKCHMMHAENKAKEECGFRTVPTAAMFDLMKQSMSYVPYNRPTIREMCMEVKHRILAIDPDEN